MALFHELYFDVESECRMTGNQTLLSGEILYLYVKTCVDVSAPLAGYRHLADDSFIWEWRVDIDDESQGLLVLQLDVRSNQKATETTPEGNRLWINPHHIAMHHQLPDGSHGDQLEYEIRPSTAIGIDPGGIPRGGLSSLQNHLPYPRAA